MNGKRSYLVATGAIVAIGLVGIVLGVVTLVGWGSARGDVPVSSAMLGSMNLAVVLVGAVVFAGLGHSHLTSRRLKHLKLALASDAPPA